MLHNILTVLTVYPDVLYFYKIMSHSFYKMWIHSIWSTKERAPLIHANIESQLYRFMSRQFQEIGCPARIINGMPDHIHCLFSLSPQKSVADVIKQIKGSSSHYVNQHNLIANKFAWQKGYAAYSISESAVEKAYLYILNQKNHHQTKPFLQEYEDFIKLYESNLEDKNG